MFSIHTATESGENSFLIFIYKKYFEYTNSLIKNKKNKQQCLIKCLLRYRNFENVCSAKKIQQKKMLKKIYKCNIGKWKIRQLNETNLHKNFLFNLKIFNESNK